MVVAKTRKRLGAHIDDHLYLCCPQRPARRTSGMQEGQVSVFKTQRTRIACDTARCMVHQHLLVDRFRSVSSSQFESSAFSGFS